MKAYYCHLGLRDYRAVHALQTDLVQQRRHGRLARDLFLITEHPAVFTLGRRGGREHLRVSEQYLRDRGIPLVPVERGGDITYHGPGQMIVYPIIELRRASLSAGNCVSRLEEVMLRLALEWGVTACRDPRNRGVWSGNKKLGSVGIAIRHGITFHGLALNVNPSLTPFEWINPCGLIGIGMTSLEAESGRVVTLTQVQATLIKHLATVFERDFQEIVPTDLPLPMQSGTEFMPSAD